MNFVSRLTWEVKPNNGTDQVLWNETLMSKINRAIVELRYTIMSRGSCQNYRVHVTKDFMEIIKTMPSYREALGIIGNGYPVIVSEDLFHTNEIRVIGGCDDGSDYFIIINGI